MKVQSIFKDNIISYTAEEHRVWEDLMRQQLPLVRRYACPEYLDGLKKLELTLDTIPDLNYVASKLECYTNWTLCPVSGLIKGKNFFKMLSQKVFPVVTKIRSRAEIDFYTDEAPDIFHEFFGHCPLLLNKDYANSIQKIGIKSLTCSDLEILQLAKLFWITYEFGLIQTKDGIKILGAGILPSKNEVKRAIYDFTIPREVLTKTSKIQATLRGDIPQPMYYIINELRCLYDLANMKAAEFN